MVLCLSSSVLQSSPHPLAVSGLLAECVHGRTTAALPSFRRLTDGRHVIHTGTLIHSWNHWRGRCIGTMCDAYYDSDGKK